MVATLRTSLMKLRTLCSALLGALVAATALGQGAERTLVTVNGVPIQSSTYFKRMEFLPNVGSLSATNEFVPATPGFLTLQRLINEMLLLQLAEKEGVSPTSAEIDQAVAEQLERNPQALEGFRLLGLTEEDFRYDLTVQLAEFKILTKGINITDQEIDKFYADNPAMFTIPKRYVLRRMTIADPAKRTQADSALAGGRSFEDVAKEFSEDTSQAEGGLMPEVPEYMLGEAIKAQITQLAAGQSTNWFEITGGAVKFFVQEIIAEEIQPMDDGLRSAIRRQMMVDRGRAKGHLPRLLQEMRDSAAIEIRDTPFGDQIRDAFGK